MSKVGRRVLLISSYAFSQVVLLVLLRMPSGPGEGSWLQAFRGYFSYDQLSYAAIASTTAAGVGGLPEPFTETGYSYYPSLWYRILGWIAALTGIATPGVWTIAGYLLLGASVLLIGYVAYRISGLRWSPALVGPALLVGTLSIVLHDQWFTPLDSHAVLWGPFGAIYVLNGEVAGFSCVCAALALILRVCVGGGLSPRAQLAWLTGAAALLGLTANLQTYSFLVGAGIAFSWLGAYGLLRSRSPALVIVTGVLVAATFAFGSTLADHIGALPIYGLLIACTLPGVLWLGVRHVRALAIPAMVFVLAAAPQAAIVVAGILRKDAFLTYRQDQSTLLGVPLWAGLLAALPLIAVWAFNLAGQRRGRNEPILAALVGMAFSAVMLSSNGIWGFGQEPYRLWIDSMTVSALLLAPVSAWSLARLRRTEPAGQSAVVRTLGAVAATLVVLSFLDFGAFRSYVKDTGVIRFDSARYTALATLSADVDGLLTTDPCLDPKEVKVVTRKPVAFYNLGLAWPENKSAIDAVLDANRNGVFDPDAMRNAKVRYLITDSACGTQWPVDKAMGITSIGTQSYADSTASGTLTLWKIF